jgi:ABC-type bacteriocin/lantibiotic exporter with double-glycine peptidase domain
MDFRLDLSFFSTRHSVPVKLQIRPAECGVVCLHMIYECLTGIGDSEKIRTIKKSGCQGLTFLGLIKCANFMDLIARPVIVGSNEIKNLRLPAIVHLENDLILFGESSCVALRGMRLKYGLINQSVIQIAAQK